MVWLVCLLFMPALRWLRRLMQPLKGRLVLRGLMGGLAMGIIGARLPLTIFSGEGEMLKLIQSTAEPFLNYLVGEAGDSGDREVLRFGLLERFEEGGFSVCLPYWDFWRVNTCRACNERQLLPGNIQGSS